MTHLDLEVKTFRGICQGLDVRLQMNTNAGATLEPTAVADDLHAVNRLSPRWR